MASANNMMHEGAVGNITVTRQLQVSGCTEDQSMQQFKHKLSPRNVVGVGPYAAKVE